MARRSQHSFTKRQKEIERKQRAQEKMARRQARKGTEGDVLDEEEARGLGLLPAREESGQDSSEEEPGDEGVN